MVFLSHCSPTAWLVLGNLFNRTTLDRIRIGGVHPLFPKAKPGKYFSDKGRHKTVANVTFYSVSFPLQNFPLRLELSENNVEPKKQ